MSSGDLLLLADALMIAERFVALLAGAVERVEIAGSVRRRAPFVGDIEIVAVPALVERVERDLFGEAVATTTVDLLDGRLSTLADNDVVVPRRKADGRPIAWGPKAKYLTYDDVNVDLFSPDAARFGWILALRTGPNVFSNALVTPVRVKTRSDRWGLLPVRLLPRDGWLTSRVSGERICTPDETDVFRLFGLDYIDPWERR